MDCTALACLAWVVLCLSGLFQFLQRVFTPTQRLVNRVVLLGGGVDHPSAGELGFKLLLCLFSSLWTKPSIPPSSQLCRKRWMTILMEIKWHSFNSYFILFLMLTFAATPTLKPFCVELFASSLSSSLLILHHFFKKSMLYWKLQRSPCCFSI